MVFDNINNQTLHLLHGSAGLFHLILAIYAEVAVNSNIINKDNVKTKFSLNNPITQANGDLVLNDLGSYQLSQLVPLFAFLSSFNHGWAFFNEQKYLKYVEKGYYPLRWLEYSISAGLLTVVWSTLSGVADLKTLLFLFTNNIALQFIGYTSEKATATSLNTTGEISRFAYEQAIKQQVVGFLLFTGQLIVILTAFFTTTANESDVPDFVYAIIIVLTVLYLLFGLWSLSYTRSAENKKNGFMKLKDFRKVEAGYIVLSFISKSFLLLTILHGSIRNS